MEVAALVVAIFAVGLSAWALVYSSRADARGHRLADLEERRAQREEAEALARQQARPGADYIEHHDQDGGRRYRFRVTNTGKETASDTLASLIDGNGDPVDLVVGGHDSEPAQGQPLSRVLPPGESVDLEISVGDEALARAPLFLRFEWSDATGQRDKTSKAPVPTD